MLKNQLQIFENQPIRSVWNEEEEEWYFSVVDVVGALTDSSNPRDYFKKMRKRDDELDRYVGTKCPHVDIKTGTGKARSTLAGNAEHILRIIQSIPSKKAEPFKLWLAKVGKERVDETIDPELAIARAVETYRKKGYSEDWISQRMLSIRVRNELTDEWHKRGVHKNQEFAVLTDIISEAWSGMKTREYKNYKGLKKQNLRDSMTTQEIILNMLAENTTKELSKKEQPETFDENKKVAKRGGKVALHAKQEIEELTGEKVVSPLNAGDSKELR